MFNQNTEFKTKKSMYIDYATTSQTITMTKTVFDIP